jgi:hypothetical protein
MHHAIKTAGIKPLIGSLAVIIQRLFLPVSIKFVCSEAPPSPRPEVPPSCVQVPFLLLTSVLAVSWTHFGSPEQQVTSQTRPINSQGAPLSGVVPAVCCSACVGCLWWIPTQKGAKTQFLLPWHPAAAATNNLMTDLYSANEMSGLWPGLRPQKIR